MLRKLRPRSIYDVMAAIACFGVLAGGSAYAANTIGTGDIVDNQVTSPDVRDDNLGFGGLARQELGSGSVGSSELAPFSINEGDIGTNVIDSRALIHKGGLRADVLSDGEIGVGDEIAPH